MKNILHFLNHASYAIETPSSILLCDPWLEGEAFDQGWSLLDDSTSIDQLVSFILKKKKKIYIWYSHEHSDHLSFSVLKALKKENLNVTIFFQKTLDARVVSFIRKLGFNVVEFNEKEIILDNQLSLIIYPYLAGDSYCLMKVNNYAILNLNDCVVESKETASKIMNSISKFTSKVDILATQFGYANWIGNPSDSNLRKISAEEHILRIAYQVDIIKPKIVIPFASFIYFSHEDNFYMNDNQNSPKKIIININSHNFRDKLIVMKPWDNFEVTDDLNLINGQVNSESNIKHWENCLAKISPKINQSQKFSIEELILEYNSYRKKVFKSFLFFPQILEFLGIINKIKIYVTDLEIIFLISYLDKIKFENRKNMTEVSISGLTTNDYDISLKSDTFFFSLKNQYGFNTTFVNGKFRSSNKNSFKKVFTHFVFNDLIKNGFGLNNFFQTVKFIFLFFVKKICKIFQI